MSFKIGDKVMVTDEYPAPENASHVDPYLEEGIVTGTPRTSNGFYEVALKVSPYRKHQDTASTWLMLENELARIPMIEPLDRPSTAPNADRIAVLEDKVQELTDALADQKALIQTMAASIGSLWLDVCGG